MHTLEVNEESLALLHSDDFFIVPNDGDLPLMGLMYAGIEADRAMPKIFWNKDCSGEAAFVDFFSRAALLYVFARPTRDLVGAVWFTHVVPGRQAEIGFWYRRKYWGTLTRSATRQVCQWARAAFGWKYIWGKTPWLLAVRHATSGGAEMVATLPEYAWVNGKALDVYVMRFHTEADDGRRY